MDYIVKADYWGVDGLLKVNDSWVIDDMNIFYKAKDSEGKVKELIDDIKSIKNAEIARIDINVYEIGRKVTDKFI